MQETRDLASLTSLDTANPPQANARGRIPGAAGRQVATVKPPSTPLEADSQIQSLESLLEQEVQRSDSNTLGPVNRSSVWGSTSIA